MGGRSRLGSNRNFRTPSPEFSILQDPLLGTRNIDFREGGPSGIPISWNGPPSLKPDPLFQGGGSLQRGTDFRGGGSLQRVPNFRDPLPLEPSQKFREGLP